MRLVRHLRCGRRLPALLSCKSHCEGVPRQQNGRAHQELSTFAGAQEGREAESLLQFRYGEYCEPNDLCVQEE